MLGKPCILSLFLNSIKMSTHDERSSIFDSFVDPMGFRVNSSVP